MYGCQDQPMTPPPGTPPLLTCPPTCFHLQTRMRGEEDGGRFGTGEEGGGKGVLDGLPIRHLERANTSMNHN